MNESWDLRTYGITAPEVLRNAAVALLYEQGVTADEALDHLDRRPGHHVGREDRPQPARQADRRASGQRRGRLVGAGQYHA